MGSKSTIYLVVELLVGNIEKTFKVLKDGKISLLELPDILGIGSNLLEISQLIGKADAEFKELTDDEFKELKKYIEDKTDIENDQFEHVIEAALNTAITFYRLLGSRKPEAS